VFGSVFITTFLVVMNTIWFGFVSITGNLHKVLEHAQAKTRNGKQQPQIDGNAMRFEMIGQLPFDIIGWLRDAFHLEQHQRSPSTASLRWHQLCWGRRGGTVLLAVIGGCQLTISALP